MMATFAGSKNINVLSISLGLCIGILPWSEKWNTFGIMALSLILFFNFLVVRKRSIFNVKKLIAGSIIFLVSLVWLINTDDLTTGWRYMERIVSAILFPVLFSFILSIYNVQVNTIFLLFLISCALRYFFFLLQFLDWELVYILDYWKEVLIQFNQSFIEGALHPSYFSMYLGFCSIISYYFLNTAKTSRTKSLWIIVLGFFLLINLSLGAKMPFIGTLIALMFGAFFQIYRLGKNKKKYLIGVFLGALVFGGYLIKIPNAILQDFENYYNYFSQEKLDRTYNYSQYGTSYKFDTWTRTNRIYIWKSSAEVLKDNIITGVGTGDIKTKINTQFIKDGQVYLASKNANTHNQYLDYLIKFGILGFVLIVIGFAVYFRKAGVTKDYLYLMFLFLVMLCMLTENILNRQLGIVFFFFFNSLLFFSKKREARQYEHDYVEIR